MKFQIINQTKFKDKKILFSELQKQILSYRAKEFLILNEKKLPIILSVNFFFRLIKNYFKIHKQLNIKKSIFFITLLEIIDPRIIITFRTFSKIFIDIDRTGKFNCLTIQNTLLPLYDEHKIGEVKYKDIFVRIFFLENTLLIII